MIPYRDPKTGDRTAVLRPKDAALSLRRLAEWERIMDRALDDTHMRNQARWDAAEAWLAMKKEQPWTFVGWLGSDAASVVDGDGVVVDKAAPGDMHELESKMGGWR